MRAGQGGRRALSRSHPLARLSPTHSLARHPGYVEGHRAAGFTAQEAWSCGYSAKEVKAAGFVEGLCAAGFSCADAAACGYTAAQMRKAHAHRTEGA